MEKSTQEYFTTADIISEDTFEEDETEEEVFESDDESDFSGLGMPYVSLEGSQYELNNNGEFEITGHYNNVDIQDVIWFLNGEKIGAAQKFEHDTWLMFVLPVSYEAVSGMNLDDLHLKATDRRNEDHTYVDESITLVTDTSKAPQGLSIREIYDKYSENQLSMFGVQSEPAQVSNNEFSIVIYMSDDIDPNDFRYVLSGQEVIPEYVGEYGSDLNAYSFRGNLDWVYEFDKYRNRFGDDYYYFIVVEVTSKEDALIFEDYTDYSVY